MRRALILVVLLIVSATGCRTAPPSKTPSPDVSQAIPVLRSIFDEALVSAAGAQRRSVFEARRTFVMRFNQASCECPPFEVYLEGEWQRYYLQSLVEVEGSQSALDGLMEEAQRQADASRWPLYQIRGRLTGDSRASANDIEYGIVAVTDARQIGEMSPSKALSLAFEAEVNPPEEPRPPAQAPVLEEKEDNERGGEGDEEDVEDRGGGGEEGPEEDPGAGQGGWQEPSP